MADVQNNLFTNLQGQPNLIASSSNPLFNESATNKLFWTVKIILMIINAFTGMIAIFIVLFGFAYPDEKFPGDLKGKNCALLSIAYIGWSLIGYCGAHHQKFSFLLVYSGLVVFYVFTNIIIGVLASKLWLDVNLFWIICGYFTILMAIGLLHAYQIRLKEERGDDLDYSNYGLNPGLSYGSTFVGQYPNQAQFANQAIPNQLPNQMPYYSANLQQQNFANNLTTDNAQMYSMPNYNMPNNFALTNNYQQQQPTTSAAANRGSGSNYFQRNWQRMSSKRMGNLFGNFRSSTYRPNGNLITTEMKPMNFNTNTPGAMMHPY